MLAHQLPVLVLAVAIDYLFAHRDGWQEDAGIGKTLGYLAPASLYAVETGGAVWLSTFTRALIRPYSEKIGRRASTLPA